MNKTVKLLLYCTVAKPYLVDRHWEKSLKQLMIGEEINEPVYKTVNFTPYNTDKIVDKILNGKIVAEADCELVERYNEEKLFEGLDEIRESYVSEYSCVDLDDLLSYKGNKEFIYGIYLKNVKPFEEPKELSYYGIKKAPQNMCYLYDKDGKIIAVVISIQAPHMCNIMNDLKTIEVRTSILNVFKELIR